MLLIKIISCLLFSFLQNSNQQYMCPDEYNKVNDYYNNIIK